MAIGMCGEIPVEVSDDERIARAVMVPAHFDEKKRKLKRAAFKPAPGTNLLSVIRANFLTGAECKAKAKAAANERATYIGFARIIAKHVRETGVEVVDAREDFMGHAHFVYDITPPPRGEPLPPDVAQKLDLQLSALANCAEFLPDPDVASADWKGSAL